MLFVGALAHICGLTGVQPQQLAPIGSLPFFHVIQATLWKVIDVRGLPLNQEQIGVAWDLLYVEIHELLDLDGLQILVLDPL